MSAYIRCYSCGCDSIDVDNADACDCDFHNGKDAPLCTNHRNYIPPPRPLSPEEKALAEAVDGKVTPSANAILWGRLLEWREWLRKEGRTA